MAPATETTLEFPRYRSRRLHHSLHPTYGPAEDQTKPDQAENGQLSQGANALAPVISIDHLYPEQERLARPDLMKALRLLAEAVEILGKAREAAQQHDDFGADRHVQRFQVMLPDLFDCRSIGDGYALLINSVHIAFVNQRGTPITLSQLTTIWRMLKDLRSHPFISLEVSTEKADELEACGLQVDPPVLGTLLGDGPDD